MLENNSLKESKVISSRKKEITRSEKPTVKINSDLLGYMVALHSKYGAIEWSGYIYYTQEGDLQDPSSMILHVTDFVLLDVGSHAYTEITPKGDQTVNIYKSRPEIREKGLKQGLLHTHNNFGTFFSGTDMSTLLDSASDFPIFLSVITNFKLEIIAKISTIGYYKQKNEYTYTMINDQCIIEEKKEECVFTFDCVINIVPVIADKFKTDVELTDKHFELKKKAAELKQAELQKSYSDRNQLGISYDSNDKYNPYSQQYDSRYNINSKNYKERNLKSLFEFEDDLLEEPKEDISLKPLEERVKDFVKACIIVDFAGDEYEHYVIEGAIQETVDLFLDEKGIILTDDFEGELQANIADIFNNFFMSELLSVKLLTVIERKIQEYIKEVELLNTAQTDYIKIAINKYTSAYINALRKELVSEKIKLDNNE